MNRHGLHRYQRAPFGLIESAGQSAAIRAQMRIPDVDPAECDAFPSIIAETSARLTEAWTMDAGRTFLWLRSLNAILALESSHHIMPLFLSLSSGDTTMIAETFANLGDRQGLSRQRVEKKFSEGINDLETVFPRLAREIRQMRAHFTCDRHTPRKPNGDGGGRLWVTRCLPDQRRNV